MNIKKIIANFNQPDVHLVVSAWPEKDNNHGIAWYTQLTLEALSRQKGQRFVVLAESGSNNTPRVYAGGRILVLRVFDNTHPSLYPTILTWLNKFNRIRNVSVHSEFGVNAGLKHYALLLPFMVLIRLTGKRVYYYAHNVVTDISFLRTHLNIPNYSWLIKLLNIFIRWHTTLLANMSEKIIVLDETLKTRLNQIMDADKIVHLPIPIAKNTHTINRKQARKALNISPDARVIMTFGFVSAYKGTDWLVSEFYKLGKIAEANNLQLVIAGGPAHSLKDKIHYREFYRRIEELAAKHPRITLTGFVPEADIPNYFAASDLVVLPYRGLMGASGALTHALAHDKPVMLSRRMSELAAGQAYPKGQLFFPLTPRGMQQIVRALNSPAALRSLTNVSRELGQSRDIETVTSTTYNALYVESSVAGKVALALA